VKLVAALVATNGAFKPVIRNAIGQVGQNREYKYATLEGLLDATMPALLAQGVIVFQAVDAETATLITRLAHVSGEWVEAAFPLKLDLPPQQLGSLLTYGRRYSLQSLLNLASEDDDDAAATAAKPPTKTPAKPKAAPVVPVPTGQKPVISDGHVSATYHLSEEITKPQQKRMFAIASKAGWSHEQMKDYLRLMFGNESTKAVPVAKYDQVCAVFAQPPEAADIPFAFLLPILLPVIAASLTVFA
jgi:hypothetical protein